MRRIFVVVERRADYSRFKPILQLLKRDPFFEIHLVVTGICLLAEHGRDVDYIRSDGFTIAAEIPMFEADSQQDSGAEMVRAIGRVLPGLVGELEAARPDIVLSGFDIGANFAVTVAASHMNIPVAHIQGGEVTGSIDESLRHAMSKFAHIHLPATELSKQRLVRMGEDPSRIFVVGCPSIDTIVSTPYVDKHELEKEIGVDFSKPTVLMIQHPVTTEMDKSLFQIRETLAAIKSLGIQAVVLLPNNDAGHAAIIREIKQSGLRWYASLPAVKFVNLYRNVWALVGNSSSGIHETPTMRIPAVNIGSRQRGRERAANVIDVDHSRTLIRQALQKALFDGEFRRMVRNIENPYGDGHSAEKIVNVLKTVSLENIIQKQFYE
jgi:GDP/UDP-N,N'-diacetylbacillosamine 2-epimerase (hydrolysing)